MRNTFTRVLLALSMLSSFAFAQPTRINPTSQINWPLIGITGADAPVQACTSVNYGQPFQRTDVTPNKWGTCGTDGWQYRGTITSLTTTGTSGPAAVSGGVLNIPQYQGALTLTTTGSCAAATLIANTLNIPVCSGGGGMTWPSVAGYALYSGSSSWSTPHLTDSGSVVTSSEPVVVTVAGGGAGAAVLTAGTDPGGTAGTATYTTDATSGFAEVHEGTGALARVCTASNGICTSGSSGTPGYYALWSSPTALTNGHFDDGITTAGTITSSIPLAAPTVNASVNTQINVMAAPFNAKGDCSTNDTAAVAAAQTAAEAYAYGNSLPASIVFPKPPGGCYIVSNLTYQGVSMEGQPSGVGTASPANASVMLKSLPGQDVLHVPDPTTTTGAIKVWPGWSIINLGFIVDDSVTGSFPNRYPGRWFDDGAMTAGSAVFVTAAGTIAPGDVGQAIQVNGAGAGGSNLVTTIASVTPGWALGPSRANWQVVTLAATASTTVSNAHTYISLLGLPVTFTIGQCAIALDMTDGNPADWVASSYNVGAYPKLENVSFNHVEDSNGSNTCYIYNQGGAALYGLDASNLGFFGSTFQVVQGTNVLNSTLQPGSGDFQKWDHIASLFGDYPWISYNGLGNEINLWQITAPYGPQILALGNNPGDGPAGLSLNGVGMESPSSPSSYGFRIVGQGDTINARLNSGATGQYATLDTVDSQINAPMSYVNVNGFGNRITAAFGEPSTGTFTSTAFNSSADFSYIANPIGSLPTNYRVELFPTKEDLEPINEWKVDAGLDGNASTPYSYKDLTIWPNDIAWASYLSPWSAIVQPDSTSPSGYYLITPSGRYYNQFNQALQEGLSGSVFTIGTNLPLTGVTVTVLAKCPSGTTTWTYVIQAQTGSHANVAESCNTTYQYYTASLAWASGDAGKTFAFGSANNTAWIASAQIVPWKSSINGKTIPGAGASIATGPATSTSGDCVKFADGVGTLADAGAACAGAVVDSFTGDGVVLNNSASTAAVTATLATHSANTVLAGPSSGSAATPTFRGLVSADIPNNAANTSGNAATATALAATPTPCSAGQAPTGVLANGNSTGCAAIGGGGLSGMTASQVPIAATASTVTSSKALAGTGTGIETGPTSGTNNYDLACFADTAGTLKDCSAANQVSMAYASGIAFNLNSTGGPAAIYLNGGSTSSTIGVVHEVSGTDYWRDALSGFGSGSDYVIRDDKAGKYILDFPSNTMPAQSIGGNANGPVLLVMQVPSARKGTFTCTAGGTITVTNSNELATSDVIISLNTAGGTISTVPAMKTVTAGTGFSVLCGAADTSTYNYDILN